MAFCLGVLGYTSLETRVYIHLDMVRLSQSIMIQSLSEVARSRRFSDILEHVHNIQFILFPHLWPFKH